MLCILAVTVVLCALFAGASPVFADNDTADASRTYSVTAHGGIINRTTSERTLQAGSVIEVALDEKIWSGHSFLYWQCDDGTIIPQKTFRALVERDMAIFPVFSDLKGSFGEWAVYKQGKFCVDATIYMRGDEAKGLKEFKYQQGSYDHTYEYEEVDGEYHTKNCSRCPYSEKIAHRWNEGVIATEPTHGKEGVKRLTCLDCGATKTTPVEKTAEHSFPFYPKDSDYDIVTPAKNGQPGVRRLKCTEGDAFGPEQAYIEAELPASAKKVQHYRLVRTSNYGTNSGMNRARIEEHYISDKAYYYAVKRDASPTGFALLWFDEGENSPVYVQSGTFSGGGSSFTPDSRYGTRESGYYGILCYVDSRQEFLDLICRWSGIYQYDNGLSVSNFYYTIASGYKYYAALWNDGKQEKLVLKNEDQTLSGWNRAVKVYEYKNGNSTETLYVDALNVCVKAAFSDGRSEISYLGETDDFPFTAPERKKITHYSYHVSEGSYQGVYDDRSYFGMTSKESSAENRSVKHRDARNGEKFSHWEKYDPYTHKWEFCSFEESWTPSLSDVTTLRAVFKDSLYHIKVNGGYFRTDEGWYDWSIKKYNDTDVVYNTVIRLYPDSKQTPKGKQFAGFTDSNGDPVTENRIFCQADAEYFAVYEDQTAYFDADAEHGVIKKDGEIFTGGQIAVGKQITLTTESSDKAAYPHFLGWCHVGWGPGGNRVYTLISEKESYTVTVTDDYDKNRITAVWSAETSLPVYTVAHHDLTVHNGLLRTYSNAVAASCIRVPDESTVWAIGDPSVPRELNKWVLTDKDGDGTAIETQEYDKTGNRFYIRGSYNGSGKPGGKYEKGEKGGPMMSASPENILITGYFKSYCAHACSVCGFCTLPGTDPACHATRCTCDNPGTSSFAVLNNSIVNNVSVNDSPVQATAYTVDLTTVNHPYLQNVLHATNGFAVEELYDISLIDADGNPYEWPDGQTATVTLSVGGENAAGIQNGTLFIAHITETGTDIYGNGYLPATVNESDGTVSFTTDEFSPFALVSAQTFTVTFHPNGGTGTMDAAAVAGRYTLPDCTFTAPAGKQFKGWALREDGEVLKEATCLITENTGFYAIWEDIPEKKGLPGGAVAGIVIGSIAAAGIGGFAIFWFAIRKKSFADLIAACKNLFKKS